MTRYVDGAPAAAREEAEVERHLSLCAPCAAQATFERELRESLSQLSEMEPSPGLLVRVRATVGLAVGR